MKAKICKDDQSKFYGIRIDCPGCGDEDGPGAHVLPVHWLPNGMSESEGVANKPHWTFNGNMDSPTFSPSILSSYEQWVGTPKERKHVCHSFVTDGKIQFLSDCTHSLAGQTVELPDLE